jgi:cytochrome c oxidase cbb3-type subunit 4
MDINEFRSWFTLLMILIFIGIVVWAYSPKRKKEFHDAANLAVKDPELPPSRATHNKGETQ